MSNSKAGTHRLLSYLKFVGEHVDFTLEDDSKKHRNNTIAEANQRDLLGVAENRKILPIYKGLYERAIDPREISL